MSSEQIMEELPGDDFLKLIPVRCTCNRELKHIYDTKLAEYVREEYNRIQNTVFKLSVIENKREVKPYMRKKLIKSSPKELLEMLNINTTDDTRNDYLHKDEYTFIVIEMLKIYTSSNSSKSKLNYKEDEWISKSKEWLPLTKDWGSKNKRNQVLKYFNDTFKSESERRFEYVIKHGIPKKKALRQTIENVENLTVKDLETEVRNDKNRLEFLQDQKAYSHCELDPTGIISVSGGIIPFLNRNQGPRNVYQCSMSKQALGIPLSTFMNRFDTTLKVLESAQRPLLETQVSGIIGMKELPTGKMINVAIMPWRGFDQDDAFCFNKQSIDLGLFMYVKYGVWKHVIKNQGDYIDRIGRPTIRDDERYAYRNIDQDGYPIIGSVMKERDCILGKISTPKSGVVGSEKNSSIFVKLGEEGVVERVIRSTNDEGSMVIKIRTRLVRKPQTGDKFAPRMAQKGTIGIVIPKESMPQISTGPMKGTSPDLILNPLSFISRMTLTLLFEIIGSKVSQISGERVNASGFRPFDIDLLKKQLLYFGFNSTGKETFIDGVTGETIDGQIFTGPCYYQELKHHVIDKIYQTADAAVNNNGELVAGRSNNGALRFGEMERDSLISHGAASALKDRLCDSSDAYKVHVCINCGTIAHKNPTSGQVRCTKCGVINDFSEIIIPYAFKKLIRLLEGMALQLTIDTSDIKFNKQTANQLASDQSIKRNKSSSAR